MILTQQTTVITVANTPINKTPDAIPPIKGPIHRLLGSVVVTVNKQHICSCLCQIMAFMQLL